MDGLVLCFVYFELTTSMYGTNGFWVICFILEMYGIKLLNHLWRKAWNVSDHVLSWKGVDLDGPRELSVLYWKFVKLDGSSDWLFYSGNVRDWMNCDLL
jgi:hypothetical protein